MVIKADRWDQLAWHPTVVDTLLRPIVASCPPKAHLVWHPWLSEGNVKRAPTVSLFQSSEELSHNLYDLMKFIALRS